MKNLMIQNGPRVLWTEVGPRFDELHEAIHSKQFPEKIYNPKELLTFKGEKSNKIFYIARGVVVEKDGDLDAIVPQIRHKRGNIACLQNLIPGIEDHE